MFSIIPRIIAEEMAPMMRMADEFARWPVAMSRYMVQPLNHFGESEVSLLISCGGGGWVGISELSLGYI